ncbi:MAG: nucleotidyltransferase family protein [Spirochaetales bacterium]|nr:nucleotidyltransferase family protein [Spirochaetales bacterium]
MEKRLPECLLVAAGKSQRMKPWKLGLPWGEGSMLERSMQAPLQAGCSLIVVGGAHWRALRSMIGSEALLLRNRFWWQGMGVSVRRGLKHMDGGWMFLANADMPLVQAQDYERLASLISDQYDVIRPVWKGQKGHPVLVSRHAVNHILAAPANEPIRESLSSMSTLAVEWSHSGVVDDVDTPEDYARLRPTPG